ncbi:MAG TPA: SPFH domain-containing protein [Flavobacteriales bacterium]|jgi:regulator of protease activity HflC (stomatin/prohibitin superfamily)|nr:SPFH/Band 7/PHB domain protein [Flavobacteriales bacterium]MBK6551619.1 SPFH/Band 7/PHB domain protein [Flavobacteriales bacterium]MBK7101637.1 SPFH/Band 7/PHB domain protein [Flavobacteriales bacterium]MBK7481653.1 SPFH/Band 7/PHB domain protein [Flavobacteriales bacterium]MBK7618635.1 SPFH/Band 7/PHB domain protein [Flavobacteriales bacterium]
MTPGIFILVFLALFVVFLVIKGVRIVQQSEAMVIERFGKYRDTLTAGLNIIIPVFDKPREIISRVSRDLPDGNRYVQFIKKERIDLRETVFDFPKQNVITKDNVTTEINALLYFQVMDPVKATYEIENLPMAIEKLTQTTLRNVIGELDLDECLTGRDTINVKLRVILDEASNKWGVKVNRVELQDINPPRDIREAMEKQMRAERDKRAQIIDAEGTKRAVILQAEAVQQKQINEAEGQKQAQVLEAEGDAQARIRRAQGEAEAIRMVTEAIKGANADPAKYLIAMKYLETLEAMTSGKDNKVVYIPFEATGVLSSLGGIKDMLSMPSKG